MVEDTFCCPVALGQLPVAGGVVGVVVGGALDVGAVPLPTFTRAHCWW